MELNISVHTKQNSKLEGLRMKHNDDTHDKGKDKTFFGYILLAYMMKKWVKRLTIQLFLKWSIHQEYNDTLSTWLISSRKHHQFYIICRRKRKN